MEVAAYWFALLTMLGFPLVILTWLLIHPFAHHWRKIGALGTYLSVAAIDLIAMTVIYAIREPLLRIHFGVRLPLVVLAGLFMGAAIYLGILRSKNFPAKVLVGFPEVSRKRFPGKLITGGVYSRIRNPRYLEGGLGMAAVAFFSNYLATYIILLAYIPAIYWVVLLEERELKKRFGAEYDEYCKKVPRFIPR